MEKKVTICDGCGIESSKKLILTEVVHLWVGSSSSDDTSKSCNDYKVPDLCIGCMKDLLRAAMQYVPHDIAQKLAMKYETARER